MDAATATVASYASGATGAFRGFVIRFGPDRAAEARIAELEAEVRDLIRWREAAETMALRMDRYERLLDLVGETQGQSVTARVVAEAESPFAASRIINAGAANDQGQFNAGLLQQAGLFNAGAANDQGQFLAGAQNTVGLQNAQNQQQATLANASNQLNASQANQSAGLQANAQNLQGVGLLGNLGQQQQQMGLADSQMQNQFGQQQTEMDQAALDRQFQQYLLQQGYTQDQIRNQFGLLGAIPGMYAGASTSGTQTSTPSIAQVIGTAAQTAAMFSDVRLKADIEPVGVVNGRNWYRYRYLWDEPGTVQLGVMAQEIAASDPQAVVVHPSGYLMVDYGRLN
jgi:hypothetical protein